MQLYELPSLSLDLDITTMSFSFLHFSLILALAVIISITMNDTVHAYSSNITDQQALLAVKASITGPLGALNSWNHSIHFCQWEGVSCSNKRQRVTALNLSSQQLEGTLSPHIGNLSFLRGIYLDMNNFHGSIPNQVGRLFRLQYLIMSNNYFQGGFPMNLSHCSDTRTITLEGNNLGHRLPTDFTSWSKLVEFNVNLNHFIGSIPSSVGNMSSLCILHLGRNNLTGSIPLQVTHLLKLEYLVLNTNHFSGTVPLPLHNISSLSVITVATNQLEGSLPTNLGFTLPNLRIFYAGGNNLSGPFPSYITNASKLVEFDIGFNNIYGPLPMNLGSLLDLETLNLDHNKVGQNQPPDGLSFLSSLVNSTRLKFLDLYNNGLRGELPDSFFNLSTNLESLIFAGNYIYGGIPQEIGRFLDLTTLVLSDNMLTGSIPESICKLSKLRYLYLRDNNISGIIPACIGNITGLLLLTFGSNMLRGRIPTALFNISSLQKLELSSNQLSGVIPGNIMGLSSQCIYLYLDQNLFTGPLPSNIGSLIHLVDLRLSYNKMKGEIPTSLGDCVMLEELHMQGNLFEGRIPPSFKNLKNLAFLDLSSNNISGSIPHFLGQLRLVKFLNLSHNKLGGEVPRTGPFSNLSAFSVVENLQLCGGIQALQLPACPSNISKTKKKKFSLRIMLILVLIPLAMLLACFTFVLYRVKRLKQENAQHLALQENAQHLVLQDDQYPRLSYQDLLEATNEFSLSNLVGEGRYSSVYKGILKSLQQIVAVKVLNVGVHGANKNFLAECETLRNIRHRNLIKIITACSSTNFKGNDFKALVFEFMPNRSLDNWLHPSPSDEMNERNLTLFQRLNIAIDVASAVDYLRHQCHTKIIHCDIKPSNILLDEELVAHVSDFGLARFLLTSAGGINQTQTSSTGVRGTIGYVPPEYGMGEKISAEGDVYSYGILLLEMFSGKRPTGSTTTMDDNACSLHDYVSKALPDGVTEIADPRIIQQVARGSLDDESVRMEDCLASIFRVGVLCSVQMPRERMKISVAIKLLHIARDKLLWRGQVTR